MFKLDLEKAEEPETKLPTSAGSWKTLTRGARLPHGPSGHSPASALSLRASQPLHMQPGVQRPTNHLQPS